MNLRKFLFVSSSCLFFSSLFKDGLPERAGPSHPDWYPDWCRHATFDCDRQRSFECSTQLQEYGGWVCWKAGGWFNPFFYQIVKCRRFFALDQDCSVLLITWLWNNFTTSFQFSQLPFNFLSIFSTSFQFPWIQVWGCGGVEAIKSQADQKKWESKEIEKRKKVKNWPVIIKKKRLYRW